MNEWILDDADIAGEPQYAIPDGSHGPYSRRDINYILLSRRLRKLSNRLPLQNSKFNLTIMFP